jgi:hypothetical protein
MPIQQTNDAHGPWYSGAGIPRPQRGRWCPIYKVTEAGGGYPREAALHRGEKSAPAALNGVPQLAETGNRVAAGLKGPAKDPTGIVEPSWGLPSCRASRALAARAPSGYTARGARAGWIRLRVILRFNSAYQAARYNIFIFNYVPAAACLHGSF